MPSQDLHEIVICGNQYSVLIAGPLQDHQRGGRLGGASRLWPVEAGLEEAQVSGLVRHHEPCYRVALSVDGLHCLRHDVHMRLGVDPARDRLPGELKLGAE